MRGSINLHHARALRALPLASTERGESGARCPCELKAHDWVRGAVGEEDGHLPVARVQLLGRICTACKPSRNGTEAREAGGKAKAGFEGSRAPLREAAEEHVLRWHATEDDGLEQIVHGLHSSVQAGRWVWLFESHWPGVKVEPASETLAAPCCDGTVGRRWMMEFEPGSLLAHVVPLAFPASACVAHTVQPHHRRSSHCLRRPPRFSVCRRAGGGGIAVPYP